MSEEKDEGLRYAEYCRVNFNWASRDIDRLQKEVAALTTENARLREAVDAFTALINESSGVYGLHLNGDLAPWDELMAGGRFEEWLLPLALLGGGE